MNPDEPTYDEHLASFKTEKEFNDNFERFATIGMWQGRPYWTCQGYYAEGVDSYRLYKLMRRNWYFSVKRDTIKALRQGTVAQSVRAFA